MSKLWTAVAPSNIALIKYMGKINHDRNVPTSPSLSLTLKHLRTKVTLEKVASDQDLWEPLHEAGCQPTHLSEQGRQRFLSNWQRLKEYFGIQGFFRLSSANNFPADCGIASSASSFAALTMVAFEAAQEIGKKNLDINLRQIAALSQEASGSSCRSFLGPWCLWNEDGISRPDFALEQFNHQVIIVDSGTKKVSSSEAHKRVDTSLLSRGRSERARVRLNKLMASFSGDVEEHWSQIFETCWAEFMDMHALFATANPSFEYMTAGSFDVLTKVKEHWRESGDGPLVTMDAGANVHLIYRLNQEENLKKFENSLEKKYEVISGRV